MRIVEHPLMLKEVVVHLPELRLDGGSFRGLRGMLSMRVALGQGKVPKDKAQPIPQTSLNLLDDGIGPSTIGTLIITVFHHGHRGGDWSLLVIALADWQGGSGRSWFLRQSEMSVVWHPSRAGRVPRSPGQMRIGSTE